MERRLQRLGNELIGNASISKELLHGPIYGRGRIFICAPFDARPVEAKACCGRQPSFSTGGKDQHTGAGAVLTNVGIEAPIAHQFGQSESFCCAATRAIQFNPIDPRVLLEKAANKIGCAETHVAREQQPRSVGRDRDRRLGSNVERDRRQCQ